MNLSPMGGENSELLRDAPQPNTTDTVTTILPDQSNPAAFGETSSGRGPPELGNSQKSNFNYEILYFLKKKISKIGVFARMLTVI